MDNNFFYCYSIKLKDFLKLQGLYYDFRAQHINGNSYWAFVKGKELDEALQKWEKYKKIFLEK